jgi:5-methylcytosine-specific restriction endonuclease McrA
MKSKKRERLNGQSTGRKFLKFLGTTGAVQGVSFFTLLDDALNGAGYSGESTRKLSGLIAAKTFMVNYMGVDSSVKATQTKKQSVKRVRNSFSIEKNDGGKGAKQTSKQFLESWEWTTKRMEAIKLFGVKCMCCGASRDTGAIIHVDHIKPRSKYPELSLDLNNLQILCMQCNKGKGAWDETDWRTNEQKELLK